MTLMDPKIYKAPRWITTEAGQWAYHSDDQWRQTANNAFGVAERRKLLDEAERMHKSSAKAETA
jgi:hypothetical protein